MNPITDYVVPHKAKTYDVDSEEMAVDPDGGTSSICTACRIPIFATPSVSFSHGGEQLFLHEQCATMLPEQVVHELHRHTLVLVNHLHLPTLPTTTTTCYYCGEVCGVMFYQCRECAYFQLDLLCISQIKIVHKSHEHHVMTVVRVREYSSSLICNGCDAKHEPKGGKLATLSYLCNLCGYWIHPDCASLSNVIVRYEEHEHSLFLTFDLASKLSLFHSLGRLLSLGLKFHSCDWKCVVCSIVVKEGSGAYMCLECEGYVVHIRCALTRPKTFKPVFIRDAKVSDLARLPMPNEATSLIPYIKPSTSADDHYQEKLHEHPLILHEIDDGDGSISIPRVCNACVQFISPPFFTCPECPGFFLHTSCAHLPGKIKHRVHEHPLYLSLKAPKSDVSGSFSCRGCELRCNGFAYSCESCSGDYNMDVACALLNTAITHDSHEKSTHMLLMPRRIAHVKCNCCGYNVSGIYYNCNICPQFQFNLHARCALLPTTVLHSFDKHPLRLTATAAKKRSTAATDGNGDGEICEVCEEQLDKKKWHYSCRECDQSFHIDCIPSVDRLSRIKLGSTIYVDGHDCPLALVREDDAVCLGYRCGVCREVLKSSDDGLAYECSNCFFGIHYECAENCTTTSIVSIY